MNDIITNEGTPNSKEMSGQEPRHNILLIEDSREDARLVQIFIKESDNLINGDVATRETLTSGMDELSTGKEYAAILLDLSLPDSRGFETLERLLSKFPNENVIVLTGYDNIDLGVEAVKAGAQDFLVKGKFDANSLAKTLRYSIERRSVLSRLKQAEEEKKESRQRYQNIFTQSKDAIYISDLNGKIIDCNESTSELLGYSVEMLKDMPSIHPLLFDEETNQDFLDKLKKEKTVKDFEIVFRSNNGETYDLLVSANLNESDYNCMIRDITERKRAEEAIKARDLAQSRAKVREELIASVSHEMRTPMNAILGNSNLMLQTDLKSEQLDYVTFIKQSSELLLGIINNILDIATLKNGRIMFEKKDFNIFELTKSLYHVMKFQFDKKGLSFDLNLDDKIPQTICGDGLRLNQILYNLVGNAIKFTHEGQIGLNVNMLAETETQVKLRFDVSDTGIGIEQDQLRKIFEEFTRVRQKDKFYEGTGLGLSITQKLIELQGGAVDVVSELGVGSTFSFELTFEKGQLNRQEDTPTDKNDSWEVDENLTFNLLLVEDHRMNQIVARKSLEKKWKNLKVTIAENGKEAIDILKEKKMDIILMDIQMPIMDGYETTDFIRNKMPADIAKIPILAMTAHAHISKNNNFEQYGMDDYVIKPFDAKQLFQKIEFYLNKGKTH